MTALNSFVAVLAVNVCDAVNTRVAVVVQLLEYFAIAQRLASVNRPWSINQTVSSDCFIKAIPPLHHVALSGGNR